MQTIYRFLLLSLAFVVTTLISANASHFVGGYISYEHVSGNTYTIRMKLYRDCSGITFSNPEVVNYSSASNAYTGVVNLNLDSVAVVVPSSCVPQTLTTCFGGTAFGLDESYYSATVTLPYSANDWVFYYSSCCRNSAITTLTVGGSESYYTYTTLDNSAGAINNSPQFNSSTFNEFCAGIFSTVDYSCTDADGDSLTYVLDTCFSMQNISVVYAPGYSPYNFISSFTPINLNASSGMMTFTPSMIQIGVVSVIVNEYRNGVKIASMKRDDEIVIVNGIQNPDIISGVVYHDANNNGVKDAGETGIQGAVVSVQPGNFYCSSDTAGAYAVNVIPGSYTVNIPNPPVYFSVNPASYTPSFAVLGTADSTNHFGLWAPAGITDLMITVTGLDGAVPGTNRHYQVDVTNIGTALASGTVDFNYDALYAYVTATPAPVGVSGNTATWTLSNLLPGSTSTYNITLYLDSMAVIGDTVENNASVISLNNDTNIYNNFDELYQQIVGSYDPNQKEVSATNMTNQFIADGNYLDYTIHFQNTGTAPAMNIHINDPLDYYLDVSTIEFLASSHSSRYQVTGTGLLDIFFDNINLPDWNTDEPGSHGFFKFRIKPKNILVPGNFIMNTANIYFDFNPAITTNTVYTFVVVETGLQQNELATNGFVMYPNPAYQSFTIKSASPSEVKIEIFDMTGRMVFNSMFIKEQVVDISEFSNGLYLTKLTEANGKTITGKLIKQ